MKKPSVGIVDLADLSWARRWSSQPSALLPALGIEPGVDADGNALSWESWTSLAPCPTMLAIVRSQGLGPYASRWLRGATNVLLVVDVTDRKAAEADPDLVALEEDELTNAMGRPTKLVRWDGSPEKTAEVQAALAQLSAVTSSMKSPHDARQPVRSRRFPRAPPGAWVDAPFAPELTSRIASHAYVHGDDVVRVAVDGVLLDLATGAPVIAAPAPRGRIALTPDGRRMLASAHELGVVDDATGQNAAGTVLVNLDPPGEGKHKSPVLDRTSIGGLPFSIQRVGGNVYAGVGYRTTFSWLTIVDDTIVPIASSAHDWPCGHAKKLWGYSNNAPCALIVGADEHAYVSIFEQDALVASSLPLRWRRAGPAGSYAVVAWEPPDSLRRLFFVPDWKYASNTRGGADDDTAARDGTEEDVRGGPPAIACGPNDEVRYAVGLDRETWFIDERNRAAQLGGPDDGYIICDASHAVVRRGRGRLLCGTTRTLFVLDDGHLFRESFKTAKREDLGPEPHVIGRGHALTCADNAILVGAVDYDDENPVPLQRGDNNGDTGDGGNNGTDGGVRVRLV